MNDNVQIENSQYFQACLMNGVYQPPAANQRETPTTYVDLRLGIRTEAEIWVPGAGFSAGQEYGYRDDDEVFVDEVASDRSGVWVAEDELHCGLKPIQTKHWCQELGEGNGQNGGEGEKYLLTMLWSIGTNEPERLRVVLRSDPGRIFSTIRKHMIGTWGENRNEDEEFATESGELRVYPELLIADCRMEALRFKEEGGQFAVLASANNSASGVQSPTHQ